MEQYQFDMEMLDPSPLRRPRAPSLKRPRRGEKTTRQKHTGVRAQRRAEAHFLLLSSNTLDHRPLFTDWQAARLLRQEFKNAVEWQWVESLAWVIMPDHFYWLISPKQKRPDVLMKTVKARSALAISRYLNDYGSIWEPGYQRQDFSQDEDIKQIARKVIANPLRQGLVKHIGDYPLWDAVWI